MDDLWRRQEQARSRRREAGVPSLAVRSQLSLLGGTMGKHCKELQPESKETWPQQTRTGA